MCLLRIVCALVVASISTGVLAVDSMCASFQTDSKTAFLSNGSYLATLTFSVNNTCAGGTSYLTSIKVFTKPNQDLKTPFCHVMFNHSGVINCPLIEGCTCDSLSQNVLMTKIIDNVQGETWLLVGVLKNGNMFNETVEIRPGRALKFEHYSVSAKERSNFTVYFSVVNTCKENNATLLNIKVLRKNENSPPISICTIRYTGGTCSASPGCTCDTKSHQFSVTRRMEDQQTQHSVLVGRMQNNQTFQTAVDIDMPQEFTPGTQPPVNRIVSNSVLPFGDGYTISVKTETTHREYTQTPPNEVSTDEVPSFEVGSTSTSIVKDDTSPGDTFTTRVVLPASMGGILILVLAVLVRVEMMRRRLAGRRSSLPPPPPSPHVFRRPAPDAVAFHIQPDGENGRVSFLSVQDHVYEVMPGEDSTSSDDAFDASPSNSSPVSNSTTSDDSLLHIACPSSDSSLPDGYLHPVVSAEEASSEPEMMDESMTDLHGYNNETSATPAQADPPYENVGNAP